MLISSFSEDRSIWGKVFLSSAFLLLSWLIEKIFDLKRRMYGGKKRKKFALHIVFLLTFEKSFYLFVFTGNICSRASMFFLCLCCSEAKLTLYEIQIHENSLSPQKTPLGDVFWEGSSPLNPVAAYLECHPYTNKHRVAKITDKSSLWFVNVIECFALGHEAHLSILSKKKFALKQNVVHKCDEKNMLEIDSNTNWVYFRS